MADGAAKTAEVNARILYWGIEGAGKRTNLRVIHAKLRADHRGELRELPTRIDPSVTYCTLPIELGDVGGVKTRIQIATTPGGAEQAPSRKKLLDRVDGIVFVVDTTRARIDENLASLDELRRALAAYGRRMDDVPLVIQYNKRDCSDPYALEELHRKFQLRGAAAFEAVAKDGVAVLQTLTTVSKKVIRALRERPEGAGSGESARPAAASRAAAPAAPAAAPAPARPAPPPGVSQVLDFVTRPAPSPALDAAALHPQRTHEAAAAVQETEALFAPSFDALRSEPLDLEAPVEDAEVVAAEPTLEPVRPEAPPAGGDFEIESVGRAERADAKTVRVPVVLRDAGGRRLRVALSLRLDTAFTAGDE